MCHLCHGAWISRVWTETHLVFLQIESSSCDDLLELIVTQLDAVFAWHVVEVIQQRTKVDPQTARLEHIENGLDIFEDIFCRVDEEAGDDTVPGVEMFSARIDLDKLACHH